MRAPPPELGSVPPMDPPIVAVRTCSLARPAAGWVDRANRARLDDRRGAAELAIVARDPIGISVLVVRSPQSGLLVRQSAVLRGAKGVLLGVSQAEARRCSLAFC